MRVVAGSGKEIELSGRHWMNRRSPPNEAAPPQGRADSKSNPISCSSACKSSLTQSCGIGMGQTEVGESLLDRIRKGGDAADVRQPTRGRG